MAQNKVMDGHGHGFAKAMLSLCIGYIYIVSALSLCNNFFCTSLFGGAGILIDTVVEC